jgi:hypothetical protein
MLAHKLYWFSLLSKAEKSHYKQSQLLTLISLVVMLCGLADLQVDTNVSGKHTVSISRANDGNAHFETL